jgi:hypothetical protein
MCWEIRRPASRCLLMKRFVLKQMGADHTWCRACGAVLLVGFRSALSGNTTVDASFQKALYNDHFCKPCAGIVSALRVLGFLGPIRASECPTRTLDIWSVKRPSLTCPFVKLASATAVQGWRPKFDMHVRQPGERYSCARLASIDVAQRAWTCPFVKRPNRPESKFDGSKLAEGLADSSLFEIERVCQFGAKSWCQCQV